MNSMTGFGRATADSSAGRVNVELRSVNHRALDIKVRARDVDGATEAALVAAVRSALLRGSVTVSLDVDSGSGVLVDEAYFKGLAEAVERVRSSLGLIQPASLETLVAFANLVRSEGGSARPRMSWDDVSPAFAEALTLLQGSRRREGEALGRDLRERHGKLAELASALEARTSGASARAVSRLRQRLSALLEAPEFDPQRLAQEVAVLADRSDVTEELVRLRAHLEHLAQLVDGGSTDAEGSGRRIEFWLQEIGREFNTVASKSQDADVSALVVEAKAELEKMREQAQNIE